MGKNKCLLLARVSTQQQSLESQIEKLKEEAKRFGYDEANITIVKGKESGVKLDTEERQTIQQLKEYIEEDSSYNMVFIWEVSRLARRQKVLYEVREFLINHHVNLHCMTPYFTMIKDDGSIDPTASIVFSLFGTMAEEEARLSKERMRRGRIAKRDKCKYIGGNILFGYSHDDNDNIFIDEERAKVVIEMFERYAKRESIRSITRDMFERGLLPYPTYDTSLVMLKKMLPRSEYAGITNNSYPYPAIISEELYNKTREVYESKPKYTDKRERVQGCFWCQGLLVDKDSHRMLSPAKCTVTYRLWMENTNSGYQVNLNVMDSIAWMITKEQYAKQPIITVNEALSEAKRKLYGLHDKIIHNRERIKELQHINERINDRIIKGKLNETKGDNMIADNMNEIKNISFSIRKWDSECSIYERAIREQAFKKTSILDIEQLTDWEKKDLVQRHIRSIEISHGYKYRIITVYCFNGEVENFRIVKRGNYTDIYRNEQMLTDFNLLLRYRRKGTKFSAGMTKRIY